MNKIKALVKGTLVCGDCCGFKREKLIANIDKPCSSLGKLEQGSVCPKFRPDVLEISRDLRKKGTLHALIDLTKQLSIKDLHLLAGALVTEERTRNNGAYIGMRVYVRMRGSEKTNYMSNFGTAIVLSADQDFVRLMSDDGAVSLTYDNKGFEGPALYSEIAFAPILKKMEANQSYLDPNFDKEYKAARPEEPVALKKPNKKSKNVEPFESHLRGKPKRKKSRTEEVTLADIVAQIESGYGYGASDNDTDTDNDTERELGTIEYKRKVKIKKDDATPVHSRRVVHQELGDIVDKLERKTKKEKPSTKVKPKVKTNHGSHEADSTSLRKQHQNKKHKQQVMRSHKSKGVKK